MSSRWGALIDGEIISLESLKRKINGSVKRTDDFFISMVGMEYILRSSRWDAASDVSAARQLILQDFSVIAGCLEIIERRTGLCVSSVFEFKPDGAIDQNVQVTVSMPRRPKPEASPEAFKRLLLAAASHHLAGAISDFRGDGDWVSLYKVFEGLKRHYGSEEQFFSAFPTRKVDLVRLRRTANSYRHPGKAFAPIKNPIGLNAAKALLESIFEAVAQEQPYPNSQFPGGQAQIENYSGLSVMRMGPPKVVDRSL